MECCSKNTGIDNALKFHPGEEAKKPGAPSLDLVSLPTTELVNTRIQFSGVIYTVT